MLPAGCFIGDSGRAASGIAHCRRIRSSHVWLAWLAALLAELGTLALVWYVGSRGASSSANLQTVIAGLIVALIVGIWWAGELKPGEIPFPTITDIELHGLFAALSVMFWCFVGLEAFAHGLGVQKPGETFPVH